MLSRLGRVFRRPADEEAESDYEARIREETAIYADQEVVHDLPPIFHYWSNTHLLPVMQSFGFSSVEQFFADALERAYRERTHDGPARFASVGAGNCDTEVALARTLLERGCQDFVIDCLELNPAMLERGSEHARREGVERHVAGVEADFNAWSPRGRYDGVLANQALHHVVNLEGLFDAVQRSLTPEGRFVVSDMIGRNGHLRWPEARRIVEQFWRELPSEYRFHRQLRRQEDEFLDWDCSQEGFEGVRAQDVLPLLVERFHFELFLGFANVVDVFIDRGFGPHFDPDAEWDRDFIDRVHARDVEGLFSGELKPTHVMAVMRTAPVPGGPKVWGPLTPKSSVRRPDLDGGGASGPAPRPDLAGTLAASHPDLDVRVMRSRADLAHARASLSDRVAVERLVSEGFAHQETWTFPGHCHPCGRAVQLFGDWEFAVEGVVNFREQLKCPGCGLNNRQRFMAHLLRTFLSNRPNAETVYLYEQVTPFFAWAERNLEPAVVGSEYLGHDRAAGEVVEGVRHEDALALTFSDASLDVIVSNDVFEHVPDLDQALAESARVLREKGTLLFSIPFFEQADATVRRADLRDREIVDLLPREYHGSHVSDERWLVFQDIGWDVLAKCEEAGFRDAYLLGYHSWLYAYLGSGLQLTFVAER